MSQDDFYIGREAMLSAGESDQNFDTLAAIDCEQISALLKVVRTPGFSTIVIPKYDFVKQAPCGVQSVRVKNTLIAEGHLIFTSSNVLEQVDFLIYMDVDRYVAKERRFSRDLLQRGYDLSSSRSYYETYVVPQLKVIDRLRAQAHYIVDSSGGIDGFRHHVANISAILKKTD
jgi:uridine kinase